MIGKTLAHYELLERIGAGGMGEVYRAHDASLGRNVAIKVLPDAWSRDPERLDRFEREARTLAAVHHPNIATVFGFHQAEGIRFLAMELVEGDDLAERLSRGSLPLDEAIDIARQITDGLEEAHERGIVHRDLKPANVKVTADGRVKILDFGLAQALRGEPVEQALADSPTIGAAVTETGVILGTAAYMSPEQARGKAVDRRTDIWAFGAMLYELLTGKRAFRGGTVSDTLAAVLKEEPDWTALPAGTPAGVRRALRRCLAKDPKQRFHHVADARLDLVLTENEAQPASPSGRLPAWGWGLIAAALGAAAIVGAWLGRDGSTDRELPHREYAITLPRLSLKDFSWPVLSPDGTRLAYRIQDRLMVRDLDALADRAVTGGEGGNAPFWSPDGAWLAFGREGKLWKVRASGGEPEFLCDLPGRGKLLSGAWSARKRIAISMLWGAIHELPDRGGNPRVFFEADSTTGSDFQNLQYLPDGETLLATPHPQQRWAVTGPNMGKIMAVRRDSAWVVLGDVHCHNLCLSPSDHLVYGRAYRNRGIWAVPFSADDLTLGGAPFLVAANGQRPSVARDGTLIYMPRRAQSMTELVWVDRNGAVIGTIGKPARAFEDPALSPDGSDVAYVARADDGKHDLFVRALDGGAPVRLTFDSSGKRPSWSPDGREIVFDTGMDIYTLSADGGGDPIRLCAGSAPAISPDGSQLIYHAYHEGKKIRDVLRRPLSGSGEPSAVVDGPREEVGRLSPLGDYLAYESDEGGTDEIYLTRYPGGDGRWQVSTHGGQHVRWSPDGDELVYVDPRDALMSVTIHREPVLRMDEPVELFRCDGDDEFITDLGYDISRDGEQFLMVRRIPEEGDEPRIVVVQNWLAAAP